MDALHARHFQQARIDAANAVIGIVVDGKKHAAGDEEHFCALADAEPDDDERDEGEVRHHAEHLQRAVEHVFGEFADAGGKAEGEAECSADREPRGRSESRYKNILEEFAGFCKLPECQCHTVRRW
jgi:hypothetical protein